MAIYLNDGSILLDGGSIATNENCCCDEPCSCTIPQLFLPCDCASSDFGTVQTAGDVTVNLSGVLSTCGTMSGCPDPTGTYVRACGASTLSSVFTSFGCEDVRVSLTYSGAGGVLFVVSSTQLVGTVSFTSFKQWVFGSKVDQYLFIPTATCRPECNSTQEIGNCSAGSQAWTGVTTSGAIPPAYDRVCDVTGLTATISFGAPT